MLLVLDEISQTEMKNINLAVGILGIQVIKQLELFLEDTKDSVELILEKSRPLETIFEKFSEFLFINLRRVLLGENIVVEVKLFRDQLFEFFEKLTELQLKFSSKLQEADGYISLLNRVLELSIEEIKMVQSLIEKIESEGILVDLIDAKNSELEGETIKFVKELLS